CSVPAILTGGREEIIVPGDAKFRGESVVELRGGERDTSFGQRAGDRPPTGMLVLLWLVLLPDLSLLLDGRAGGSAGLIVPRHIVPGHARQQRRVDMSEKLQAAHGPHRLRKRVGDSLLVPTVLFEPLDGTPDIDVVHRGTDQVLGKRFHRDGAVVAVPYQDID